MKNCPFCAENVQNSAIFCKHCNNALPAEKNCPACGNKILAHLNKCPKCGKNLNIAIQLIGGLGVISLAIFILWFFGFYSSHNENPKALPSEPTNSIINSSQETNESDYKAKSMVQICASDWIKKSFSAPQTDNYPVFIGDVISLDKDFYRVDSYLDSVNSAGKNVRTNYTCKIWYSPAMDSCTSIDCKTK